MQNQYTPHDAIPLLPSDHQRTCNGGVYRPLNTLPAPYRVIRAISLQDAAAQIARDTITSRPLDLRPRKQRSIWTRLQDVCRGRMGGAAKWS